ncbi:hypothetical protein, partial [Pseudomonas aeruginosa]|uniref:hypothetical protein n=1 Tax=Pseudomonas aeruginosa TaxID=287 RepID=UPI0028FDABDB
LVLFEVESTHRLGLASAEEDGRHFARATRALAFFNGLLDETRRAPESCGLSLNHRLGQQYLGA